FACCGLSSSTDRDGVTTDYIYDGIGRLVGSTRLGITTTNVLDAVGRVLSTVRKGTDGTFIVQHQALYDSAGRLLSETNALTGGLTTYAESFDGSGQTVKTITNPDNGTRVE